MKSGDTIHANATASQFVNRVFLLDAPSVIALLNYRSIGGIESGCN